VIPSWAAVVAAVSLAIIALAVLVVAAASLATAAGLRSFLNAVRQLAGPAVDDARHLVATIRHEVEAVAGTSRELRQRVIRAADAAESRLTELGTLFDVLREEAEETALDVAATVRNVRRGLALWQLGRKALKRHRKGRGK
jgi:hypothetical protein